MNGEPTTLEALVFLSPRRGRSRSCLALCGLQCPLNSNPSVRLSTVDVRRDKFNYDNREWSLVDLGGQVAFVQLLFRKYIYHEICSVHACRHMPVSLFTNIDSPEDIMENY